MSISVEQLFILKVKSGLEEVRSIHTSRNKLIESAPYGSIGNAVFIKMEKSCKGESSSHFTEEEEGGEKVKLFLVLFFIFI